MPRIPFPFMPFSRASPNRLLPPSFSASFQTPLLRSLATTSTSTSAPTSTPISRTDAPKGKDGPTAVVFLNMGGPSTTGEVHDFLSRLFADADLIPLGPLQKYLGPLIARRRTPKIVHQYSAIGGGSPIGRWTEHQADATCQLLDTLSPRTSPHVPFVAFRYASPLTEHTYRRILSSGITRAVAFTQYPQYSCSTTGSSLNELWRVSRTVDPEGSVSWSVIDRWPTHAGFVDVVARHVTAALETYDEKVRGDVVLLFSAHSLPMSVVDRGDPYPAEVAATVHAVMERLGFRNPWRLVWQSQVGPSKWLGAQTSTAVKEYLKRGERNLLLVPIAFTSDHIETLYELDVEIIGEANEPGVRRCESLNGDPAFIDALADIVREHLEKGESCSRQMMLRCPLCVSERCVAQKTFFAARGKG